MLQFCDVEILSKEILFDRVYCNHCTLNKFKMLLTWWQKKFISRCFTWHFIKNSSYINFRRSTKPDKNTEAAIRRFYTKQALLNILHMCWSLFWNKVVGQACNHIKKETPVKVFSCEFHEILKNINFIEYPRTNDSEFILKNHNKGI